MHSRIAFLLCALPTLAHAVEPAPALASTIGQMLFGLALVLALLFGALYLIKKLSLPRGPAASSLRVIGAAAVGPRERVVLVELGDKVLVLGVAPGRVSSLDTFDAADLPTEPQADQGERPDEGFAGKLRQLMEARR